MSWELFQAGLGRLPWSLSMPCCSMSCHQGVDHPEVQWGLLWVLSKVETEQAPLTVRLDQALLLKQPMDKAAAGPVSLRAPAIVAEETRTTVAGPGSSGQ